jgi:hypothetical protein
MFQGASIPKAGKNLGSTPIYGVKASYLSVNLVAEIWSVRVNYFHKLDDDELPLNHHKQG